jgi:CHAD domain-containing protein
MRFGPSVTHVNAGGTYDSAVRSTLERELKLDLDPSFALPELPGEELAGRVFTSTYHDTPARSLGRAGITLRRRVENGKSLWQLKLPRAGSVGLARAELEEPGGPAGPPDALASLLAAHLRHGKLEPVATLRTRRSGVCVKDGERRVAEVTVDAVDVLDAGRSAGGFAELEVELVDGDDHELDRLGKRLRRAGARRSSGVPKLMRVLELEDSPAPGHDAPLLEHLRHLLDVQLRELEAHDPGVRLGDDAEDVHKFRVATRRTRALIRETRPLLGEILTPLGDELKWLAGVLGPVRDLDVLLEHLRGAVARLGDDEPAGRELLQALEAQRDDSRDRLLAALSSERYDALLDAFETAIGTLPPLAAEGAADRIAGEGFRKLHKAVEKLPRHPSDDELHHVRIKAKRARYASELAALGGSKSAARAVDALKRVQDVIGAHQDAVVAEERLRKFARAKTAVAAGRLIEKERERRLDLRAKVPDVLAAALDAGEKAFG